MNHFYTLGEKKIFENLQFCKKKTKWFNLYQKNNLAGSHSAILKFCPLALFSFRDKSFNIIKLLNIRNYTIGQ